MEPSRNIVYTSLLLAFTAGFCDAATFTEANELFSAHVTGNFIVFAYDLVKGADTQTWIKLIAFPVFIAAVITSGSIAPKFKNDYMLLLLEGIILFTAGAVTILLFYFKIGFGWWNLILPFLIVWAMGIQNAFGRIYSKAVYAQTTVMTGNVTQATLDFTQKVFLRNKERSLQGLKKQIGLIAIFLAGCIVGATVSSHFGLWTVLFPGVLLVVFFFI